MNEKIRLLAEELAVDAPAGWERIDAVFSLTVSEAIGHVTYTVDDTEIRRESSAQALRLAREHRASVAEQGNEPWLRMELGVVPDGEPELGFDDGSEPFDELLSPRAYRSDLVRYPRRELPLWLAAYARHEGRQTRPVDRAARMAAEYERDGVRPTLSMNDFPPFPTMWARWATVAAISAATRSEGGPRMLPAVGWFEGATRSGSTVFRLPGGRAVLSGGVWDAPDLAGGYTGARPMPDYYAGAPFWVAGPVLNPRAEEGMLSFCYWWDGGCWYRGQSAAGHMLADALPETASAQAVVELMSRRLGRAQDDDGLAAARRLLEAAERGAVTRALLAELLGDDGEFDAAAAWYEFFIANLTESEVPAVTDERAKDLVRQYFADSRLDQTGYPLSELVTVRVDHGWLTYAPSPQGELIIGRTLFYVADDGVVERSSSSYDPDEYAKGFAERYRARQR